MVSVTRGGRSIGTNAVDTTSMPAPKPALAEKAELDKFQQAPKTGELQKSPEFKKLDAATQKTVSDAQAAATTPEAQKNLGDLVKSPGFAKLTPAVQGEAVKALMKDPANDAYANGLETLVSNGGPYAELRAGAKGPAVKQMQQQLKDAGFDPGDVDGKFGPKTKAALEKFQEARGLKKDGIAGSESLGELNQRRFSGLSEAAQKEALAQVSNHPTDPAARTTIETMATSPGFRGLPAASQDKLLKLVGGTNRDLSGPARAAMDTMVSDPAFKNASPADQTAKLEKFLADENGLPGVVAPEANAFDAKRQPYTLHGPTEVKNHPFKGGAADAQKYEVEIGGKKVPVFVAKNTTPPLQNHSIDEVARGIAALPESSRALVTTVNVEGKTNPDDAFWAQQYNDPNFHSYMTAGEAGVISIYPGNSKATQHYLDGTMIHETGHTLSKRKWGPDSDARWDDWKKAGAADKTHASAYAKNSPSEDFAETLQLYQQVKGTPQEAEVRALMPERFKIIDELLAGTR